MGCLLCGSQSAEVSAPSGRLEYLVRCRTCGEYWITDLLIKVNLIEAEKHPKHLLSALTRQASEAGNRLRLETSNLSQLLETMPRLATPIDNMDRLVLMLSKRQQRSDKGVKLDVRADYPLAFAHDGEELKHLFQILSQQGLVVFNLHDFEARAYLTPKGWERVLELQRTHRDSNQAFVAMSFAKELDSAWEEGFSPALKSTGFDPYRVDRDQFNDKIDDHIVAEIRRSVLLVADFTGHRGGVYFEAGSAMGLGIPVIWTCRSDELEKAHFDTRQYNHID